MISKLEKSYMHGDPRNITRLLKTKSMTVLTCSSITVAPASPQTKPLLATLLGIHMFDSSRVVFLTEIGTR